MRTLILSIFLCACATDNNWELDGKLSSPESAHYDEEEKRIFVSNVDGDPAEKDGKGFISLMDTKGNMLEPRWLEGFDAPKGLASYRGVLWVADIDKVHAINIKAAQIVRTFEIDEAKLLNDIAIKGEDVYVSDTFGSQIFKISKGKVELFVKGKDLESPNGLFIHDGKLYVAAWGLTTDWATKTPGRFYSIDLGTKKKKLITKQPLGNLDGIQYHGDKFLVSDWMTGKIYQIDKSGMTKTIYAGPKGIADIGLVPAQNILVLPSMIENKVLTIQI